MKLQYMAALLLSLGLHAALFGKFFEREELVVQGGTSAVTAQLGNSFADMVSGVSDPVSPDEIEKAEPEDVQKPQPDAVRVEPTEVPITPLATNRDRPPSAPSVPPTTITESPSPAPELAPQGLVVAPKQNPVDAVESIPSSVATASPKQVAGHAETSEAIPRNDRQTPVDVTENSGTLVTPEVTEASPIAKTAPPEIEEIATGQSPETVEAADENTERPRARPDRSSAQQPANRQPQGTAAQDATRGSSAGQREAASNTSSSSNQVSSTEGNSAAATNYPGQVWSILQRGRKSRNSGRGSAVVSFRIGPNGGLAALGLGHSSGNARLDQAALDYVRRAAPFPPPPAGAETRFDFNYEVR